MSSNHNNAMAAAINADIVENGCVPIFWQNLREIACAANYLRRPLSKRTD